MKKFSIIVAVDEKMGIGRKNALPWRLSKDMQRFKGVTMSAPDGKRNAVIMGRKTWESLPEKFRPLPGRLNVVLSSKNALQLPDGAIHASSFECALSLLEGRDDVFDVFVIGGGVVFDQAISLLGCHKIYLSRITGDFSCDVFFPAIPSDFKSVFQSQQYQENDVFFCFSDLERI